jgi:hypothetical protein
MDPIYAEIRDRLCRARPSGYRDFAAILLLHQEFPAHWVTRALGEARDRACLAPEAVRQILLNRSAPAGSEPVNVPISLAQARLEAPDLSRYDLLSRPDRGEKEASA